MLPSVMTQNLLLDNWNSAKIEEVLIRHPRRPLLPTLGSEEWRRTAMCPIVIQLVAPLREMAEKEIEEPLPVLSDDLYASFRRTGVRLHFERVYFERRRRLARASLSLLLCRANDPWRQRLADSMIDKLGSIFDEVSWALPAHVNWDNDDLSGKDPLQIDLFCAETANLMAEMLDLFDDLIPAILRERIAKRLRRDIFKNYLGQRFHWKEITNNWNAVCHQGVIGCALSQLDDARLLSQLLASARQYLPNFLSGFGRDGGCGEGPGYWSYGFGWFTVLNEQLELRTQGELSLFEGDQHIREIARYGPRVSLPRGNLVNFADGSATGGLDPSLLSYLGERLNDSECIVCAQENYHRVATEGLDLNHHRNDVFTLVRLMLRAPTDTSPPNSAGKKDSFFPDLGILVAHGADLRGHRWDFAAKAGHNDEHHNHNDCGSFIVNIDGVRLISEIGAPEYVHDFFQPEKRYEFLAARTLGHSLPIINNSEQASGAAHASRILSHSLQPDQAEFVVDATLCYPETAGCRKFVRSFHFDKRLGRLALKDDFEIDQPIALESAVLTFHLVSIHGDHAEIDAGSVKLILKPRPGTQFDRVETHTYRDREGNDAMIQRLVLEPESLSLHVQMGLEIFAADTQVPIENQP